MGCVIASPQYTRQNPQSTSKGLVTIEFLNKTLINDEQKHDQKLHLTHQVFQLDAFHHKDTHTPKQDSQLLKEINFQPLISYCTQLYQLTVKDLKTHDIKGLQIVMKIFYSQLIKQKLMTVNQMKINIKQCKIQIAQSMLTFLVDVIKFSIEKHSIEHAKAVFARLQKFSKNLSGFLKTKYPQGQNIDAGKLSQEFKEFDCTQDFDHDIIANARVIFKTKQKKYPQIEKLKKKKDVKPMKQNFIGNLWNSLSIKVPEASKEVSNYDQQSQMSQNAHSSYSEGTQFGLVKLGSRNQANIHIKKYDYLDYQGKQYNSDFCYVQKPSSQISQDKNQFEITNNIKILLNRIMDQIDRKYQDFTKLMESIDTNFKVSRKISENTARCTKIDTGVVEITSIQIARVLIKWLENLQEIIEKPQELFNPKYQIKVCKYDKFNQYSTVKEINIKQDRFRQQKQDLKYAKCSLKQLQKLMEKGNMAKKLQQQYQRYKKQNSIQKSQKYEYYFKQFSTFMLANLQNSSHDQREISTSEMQTVKYAFQISNLISWIVQQKIIAIIKILTSISEQFKCENGVPNLVKFKVNDLMRCRLSGDQKTIKEAYDKILEKQAQGLIDIIKIKNRFHTDNHDAMVFFRIKGSFLVCESQLALSEDHYKNDERIKNIVVLNHFLYELERSPLGIFGQLSVFLKTQSHTVSSFYSKLKLKPTNDRVENIKMCYKLNQQRQKTKTKKNNKDMKKSSKQETFKLKPFVCSLCFLYFQEYKNSEEKIFSCQKCAINLCSHCLESKLKQKNKKIVDPSPSDKHKQKTEKLYKDLHSQIKKRVQQYEKSNNAKQKADFETIKIEGIFQPLPEQALKKNPDVQNKNEGQDKGNQQKKKETERCRQNRIKAEKLMQYFQKTESVAIENRWKIHFVIFSKIGQHQNLLLYRYNSFQGVIQNVYSPIEKYLKHEYIQLNQNDKILLFKNIYRTRVSKKEYLKEFIRKNQNESLSNIEEENQNQNQNSSEKAQSQKNLENNQKQQSNPKLSSLIEPIETIQKQSLKSTNNESGTSIFDFISIAINNFTNKTPDSHKREIVVSEKVEEQNKQIKTFQKRTEEDPDDRINKFKQILENSKLIFQYQQQIKIITTIQPSIHEFYFVQHENINQKKKSNSSSSVYFLIDTQFSIGNGEKNCIAKQLSKLPKIKSLKKQIDLSNLGANSQELLTMHKIIETTVPQIKQKPFQWIKNVKILDLSKNTLNNISILSSICPNLQRLDISQNIIQKLEFDGQFKFLQEIKAQDNLIQKVTAINFSHFKKLEILHLAQNRIDQLQPNQFSCSKIKQIDLCQNYIDSIDDFGKFKALEILNMSDNRVETVDCKKLPKTLKILDLKDNRLDQIQNVGNLSRMERINLENNYISVFQVKEYLEHLSCVSLSFNNIETLYLNGAQNLKQLYLDYVDLTDENFYSVVIEKNELQNLVILSIKSNSLTKIPNLSCLFNDRQNKTLRQVWIDNNPILYGSSEYYANQMAEQSSEKSSLNSSNKSENKEQKQQQITDTKIAIRMEKNEENKFEEDLQQIQLMIQRGIEFILPVQQGLLNRNKQYSENLLKVNHKFKQERLRYQFFQQYEDDKNDSETKKFYRQKPQTKKTLLGELSHQNSKREKQLDLTETGNHIYIRHVLRNVIRHFLRDVIQEQQFIYIYFKDKQKIGFQNLWHPQIDGIDFDKFFMFDWSRLNYINLAGCGIDDKKWNQLVQNAMKQMPNLEIINIEDNQIQQVKMSQLQGFKCLKCIFFYQHVERNPLSDASLFEIEKFNNQFNPRHWAVSNQNQQDQYEKYEKNGQNQVHGEQTDEDFQY